MISDEQFNPLPIQKTNRLNVLPANPEEQDEESAVGLGRFPSWLHRKLPKGSELWQTSRIIVENRLHTVCEEAKCPNLMDCWSRKTATFLVMGKECSRNCGFCDIDFTKQPKALETDEPERVADSVKKLGLKHVVITMVARDDLEDGGSHHIVQVMSEVRRQNPGVALELLTSDFAGNQEAWKQVLDGTPDVFNHNIETVRSLTPRVRHKATYDRTLALLRFASQYLSNGVKVKSGLMVGLGETEAEVFETLHDLKNAGCNIVTIGQYLQPNRNKLRVKAFVTPEQFKKFEEYGLSIGIERIYAGPFVRSSYHADEIAK